MFWYKDFSIITLTILLVVYILGKSKHLIILDVGGVQRGYLVNLFGGVWDEGYPDKIPLEKIPPKKCLEPLSANLFRLESSILTRAKRATNRNNVATEKRI